MKLRRYISLLLLVVYLFAAGGAAYASLSCECVTKVTTHVCCNHCVHPDDGDSKTVSAPCCGDRHSTEIELYTSSGADHDRNVRCAVIDLPPALAADCPCPSHVPALRETRALPAAPHISTGYVCPTGLRAPPVLV